MTGSFEHYNKHPNAKQGGKFPDEQLVSYPKSPVDAVKSTSVKFDV
jgi:hypothetical protein